MGSLLRRLSGMVLDRSSQRGVNLRGGLGGNCPAWKVLDGSSQGAVDPGEDPVKHILWKLGIGAKQPAEGD